MLLSIILKGLIPEIKQIVMPQNHQNIDDIRKAAHLAEKTLASTQNTNIAATFTNIVTEQIKGLADKIARLEHNNLNMPQTVPHRTMTNRKPAYNQQPNYQPVQQPNYQPQNFYPSQPRQSAPSPLRQEQTTGCRRCGEGRKHSLNQCKARDVMCNYCFKTGHLYQTCIKRLRDENYGTQ